MGMSTTCTMGMAPSMGTAPIMDLGPAPSMDTAPTMDVGMGIHHRRGTHHRHGCGFCHRHKQAPSHGHSCGKGTVPAMMAFPTGTDVATTSHTHVASCLLPRLPPPLQLGFSRGTVAHNPLN